MNTTKLTLKTYWQHAWKYPRYVVPVIAIVPFATVLYRIIPPLIAASVISRLAAHDYTPGSFWSSFGGEILAYAGIIAFAGIGLYRLDLFLVWKLETYVNRDLLRTMFNKYMLLDASFHADNFGGSLVSRANKLVTSYIRLADTLIFQMLPMIASFIAVLVITFPKSPAYAVGFLAFTLLFVTATFITSKRVRELSADEAAWENKNTGSLADAVTNVMAVKSFSAYKKEKRQFEKTTETTRATAVKVMHSVLRRDLIAAVITSSIQIMALIVAIMAVVNENAQLSVTFLLLSYTAYLTDHLWQFQSSTLRNFNRSMGDAQEAIVTLFTQPKVKDPLNPLPFTATRGSVDFKSVTFAHDDNEDAGLFNKLSLRIRPGEKIGLVGHSGGGKTTLTKLLMRLMDIDGGEILIDRQDISKARQDDLRKYLSYVPQEPVMFHRSIAENIAYGRNGATQREIEAVARQAHAHDFITSLPDGYKTLVGERGVKLSGGQRQRIAIARAMLKNAPILLLDEATSALDSESEKLIQDALWKLMKDKTAIVIAHRLSTIQMMDRILVLENGEIVEEGTHRELLRNDGIYSELWTHQTGGFLED